MYEVLNIVIIFYTYNHMLFCQNICTKLKVLFQGMNETDDSLHSYISRALDRYDLKIRSLLMNRKSENLSNSHER